MPRPHTTMRQIRDVVRLSFAEQLSLREVASSLSLPRSTVADYVRRAKAAGLSWPLPEDLEGDDALEKRLFASEKKAPITKPAPDFVYVHKELRKKGVTRALLWLEWKEIHPEGYSYSQFCRDYRNWRSRVDVVLRQEHKPGELFVDFPGMRIPIYDETTLEVDFHAELFVAVMGVSNYLYCEALRSQELEHWITAHVHCFEYLGGIVTKIVPDNLKSGVTKSHRYEPDANATYQEMASHYGTVIIPARPYKPRDKAKVEAGVQFVERWIIARLRKERFTSLGALNERIYDLVEMLNDRPFTKLEGTRRSLFNEIDQPALKPLPLERYEFATWLKARVNIDYHLQWQRNFYSVPYTLAREVVDVRATSSTLEVFAKGRRVAAHQRSYAKNRYVTERAHMPDSHRRYLEWTPGRIIAWAMKNGPSTGSFIEEVLARRPHPEQGFRSALGVMRLAQRYGDTRLELACARATTLQSFSYKSVESILKHGLDQRPLLGSPPSRSHPTHANIRGADHYQ